MHTCLRDSVKSSNVLTIPSKSTASSAFTESLQPQARRTRLMSSDKAEPGDCWRDSRKSSALDCRGEAGFIIASEVNGLEEKYRDKLYSLNSGLSAEILVSFAICSGS